MSEQVKPFPFDVSNASEEAKNGLRDWGDAIVELQKHLRWDESDNPEGRSDIFHTEHCHLPLGTDGKVLCFGNLYFFNNGDRILCYTSAQAGVLQMMGGPDELKKAFGWMVAFGLVSPHLSVHVPGAPTSRAAH